MGRERRTALRVFRRFTRRSPPEAEFYDEAGHVRYDKVAQCERFQAGVEKLLRGARRGIKVALMCSEEDPLVCHRHLLVGRVLEKSHSVRVLHLRGDGRVQTTLDAEGANAALPSLFDEVSDAALEKEWKSIPSVLRKRPPKPFSGD
ncbi:MAG: DUF488 family protein [Armatimonadetes bacterium]|nr:DUF488 family protein [Armatimonadota bacterium]